MRNSMICQCNTMIYKNEPIGSDNINHSHLKVEICDKGNSKFMMH
jgi:hypothetical protein